jgi:hypothetical protein
LNLGYIYTIDTSIFNASDHDLLLRKESLYSTLSNVGLAHNSFVFIYPQSIGFDMSISAFSSYLFTKSDLDYFMPYLPYSEVRYVMTTVDKEQHLDLKFSKQFASKLYISFEYNLNYSPGIFKNNRINNNYFWINARYATSNYRYGVIAYYFRNKLEMQENGGLVNDFDYVSGDEKDPSVIPTNLVSATNLVKVSGFGLNQYFNLLPNLSQRNTEILSDSTLLIDSLTSDDLLLISLDSTITSDTIMKKSQLDVTKVSTRKLLNLGRVHYDLNYQKNQLFYNEYSPCVSFYEPFDIVLDSTKSYDTTIIHSIKSGLRWSSLGYKKYNDDVPFYFYSGIDYGFYKIKGYLDYLSQEYTDDKNFTQATLNGGIVVNLFKSARITGSASLITLGYQSGDFNVDGQWMQYLGTKNKNLGALVFDVNLKRQSPSWFETEYYSNHFRWNNAFDASTYLTLKLQYQYQAINVGIKQTSFNNYIYFNTLARPEQYNGNCSVMEAFATFYLRIQRLEMKGLLSVQQSSNEDIIRLPLLLGKMKVGYSQPIFHNTATLQPSLTIQYFTKYYADAYMPALRTFFLQDDVMIGDYPFIDFAVSIKVKRANIYVEYSNLFLLSGNRNSFIAPHYPMRGSKLFFGINWRLFG